MEMGKVGRKDKGTNYKTEKWFRRESNLKPPAESEKVKLQQKWNPISNSEEEEYEDSILEVEFRSFYLNKFSLPRVSRTD